MRIDEYDSSFFQEFKPVTAVYFLMSGDEVVYVGRTKNLAVRVKKHEVEDYDRVLHWPVAVEDLSRYENFYIQKYLPKYNKNGHSPETPKPRLGRRAKISRNEAIKAAFENGESLAQIAAEHGITKQRVSQILHADD